MSVRGQLSASFEDSATLGSEERLPTSHSGEAESRRVTIEWGECFVGGFHVRLHSRTTVGFKMHILRLSASHTEYLSPGCGLGIVIFNGLPT